MAAKWTLTAAMFSSMEKQGWQLFDPSGNELTRKNALNRSATLGWYTIKFRDSRLAAITTPVLSYSGANVSPARGSITSEKVGDNYQLYVENTQNRTYGVLLINTSGTGIPELTINDPVKTTVNQPVEITCEGGSDTVQFWCLISNSATGNQELNTVNDNVGSRSFSFTPTATGDYVVYVGAAGSATATKTITISDAVSIPDTLNITSYPAKVVRGTEYSFVWEGGVYPYTIVVSNSVGNTVKEVKVTEGDKVFKTTGDDWPVGTTYFTISCAHDDPANVGIQIKDCTFSVEDAPVIIEPLEFDSSNPETGKPNQDVVIKWKNGYVPYNVRVYNAAGATVQYLDDTNDTQIVINQGSGEYTIKLTDNSGDTLYGTLSIESAPVVAYTFTSSDIAMLKAADVVMRVNGEAISKPTQLFYGDKLEATVASGYEFTSDAHGVMIRFATTGSEWNVFDVNASKTVATFTMEKLTSTSWVYESFFVATQIKTKVSGTNHVYRVDDDIMRELTAARFVKDTLTSDSTQVIDYGSFIVNLIQLPFKISDSLTGVKDESIKLGTLDSKVNAKPFLSDLITIDLGVIKVPATYGNMLDFANTVAVLNLPRIPSMAVDLQYVIGKDLYCKLTVDVYTGRATVLLSNEESGAAFFQHEVDLGINIPYANLQNVTVENSNVELGSGNGVTVPFIELSRNDAILPFSVFNAVVPEEGLLSGAKGFTIVENVLLQTSALGNEKSEIIGLLEEGVYFK